MTKSIKYTSPIDRQYARDSQPFAVEKEEFGQYNLKGICKYRMLLTKLHSGDEERAETEYQRKVQSWLNLKFKVSAQQLLDLEIDILGRIVGFTDDDEPQRSDHAIDAALDDWFIEALTERMG